MALEEDILSTENLTKTYGKKTLVKDLNLNIKKGVIYGFIGKNGAGKTTTMKLIASLWSASSGRINFSDDFCNGNRWRQKLSAVVEKPTFVPYMSARQNLNLVRISLGVKNKSCVNELLELVGLSDVGKKSVKKFSLGMKQRLGIAIALVGEPELLLLDEPINGLDPSGVRDIRDLIIKLRDKGVTVIISSHILSELLKISDRYMVINNGDLVDEFGAQELKSRLKNCIIVKVNDVQKAVLVVVEGLKIQEYQINENEIKFFTDSVSPSQISEIISKNDVIIESIYSQGGDYEDYFIKLMEKTIEDKNSLQETKSDINENDNTSSGSSDTSDKNNGE